jgi:O-antigen ligase
MGATSAETWRIAQSRGIDLTFIVFLSLPVLGLISGPTYAPMVFGLGALTFAMKLAGRTGLTCDVGVFVVVASFVALGWLGTIWSIAPQNTLHASLQLTLIALGAFAAMVGLKDFPAERSGTLLRRIGLTFVFAATILAVDAALNFPLMGVLGKPPYKYNRGISHNLLIVWPILAGLIARDNRKLAAAVAVAAVVMAVAGWNTSARVALLGTLPVFGLAFVFPRLIAPVLWGGIAALALAMPFALNLFTHDLAGVFPYLKLSGIHRLEIWDFLASHVIEHPVRGWGLWTTRVLPVTPEALGHHVIFDGYAVHPHNQWMQLWVETGIFGVICGLALLALLLRRIETLSPGLRPHAYACMTMALILSFSNYEVTTDSWWAAIVAAAILFRIAAARQTT